MAIDGQSASNDALPTPLCTLLNVQHTFEVAHTSMTVRQCRQHIPEGVIQAAMAASVIFEALVGASLREFAAGAFDDEAEGEAAAAGEADESTEREQAFARSAALARASPEAAMLLLARLIQDRLQKLQQCTSAGHYSSLIKHLSMPLR